MNIRTAEQSDLSDILSIYAYAREQMRRNGNPSQWGSDQPAKAVIEEDIKNRNLYIVHKNGQICGVFAFIIGEDPTYRRIEGKWLNTYSYGTVHRIAGNGRAGGIMEQCLAYCALLQPNIRIDTHPRNTIMQHLLEKNGFTKCGIIYVRDGTPRIAYQRFFK